MDPKNVNLTNDISAFVKHSVPVKAGAEEYRIIVGILSHHPEKNKLIKDYYVWVSGEYLEDRVNKKNSLDGAEVFALDFLKKRFLDEGNTIPQEDGVFCSNATGAQFVNPKTFLHPVER